MTSAWVTHPEVMAAHRRRKDAISEALRARGVNIEEQISPFGVIWCQGGAIFTLRGLVRLWFCLYPTEFLPTPKEDYTHAD